MIEQQQNPLVLPSYQYNNVSPPTGDKIRTLQHAGLDTYTTDHWRDIIQEAARQTPSPTPTPTPSPDSTLTPTPTPDTTPTPEAQTYNPEIYKRIKDNIGLERRLYIQQQIQAGMPAEMFDKVIEDKDTAPSAIFPVFPPQVTSGEPLTETRASQIPQYAILMQGPEKDLFAPMVPNTIVVNGEEIPIQYNKDTDALEYIDPITGKSLVTVGDEYIVHPGGLDNHLVFNPNTQDEILAISYPQNIGGETTATTRVRKDTITSEVDFGENGVNIRLTGDGERQQLFLPNSYLNAFGKELKNFESVLDIDGTVVIYAETTDGKTINVGDMTTDGIFESDLTGSVTATVLNVRDKPYGKLVGKVRSGNEVIIIGEQDGWYKIQIKNKKGEEETAWVSSTYVDANPAIVETPQQTPTSPTPTVTPTPSRTPTKTPTPRPTPTSTPTSLVESGGEEKYTETIKLLEDSVNGVGTITRISSLNTNGNNIEIYDKSNPDLKDINSALANRLVVVSGDNTHLGYTAGINLEKKEILAQTLDVIMNESPFQDYKIILQYVTNNSSSKIHTLQSQAWSSVYDDSSKTFVITIAPTGPGFDEKQWAHTIETVPLFAIVTEIAYQQGLLPSQILARQDKTTRHLPGALVNQDMQYVAKQAGAIKKELGLPDDGLQKLFLASK